MHRVTLCAIPKPFQGHTAIIQQNAIQSWLRLRPACDIILFGDELGTAELASRWGIRHLPEVERNELGTPLVSSLFREAQRAAQTPLVCYVNCDVMLMPDFLEAVAQAPPEWQDRFLMVGRVWRVRLDEPWDFDAPKWVSRLRQYVIERGGQAPPPGNSDYFVFPKDFWREVPPCGIGRGFWEAWLIYEARRRGVPVIDASPSVMAIHQDHDQGTYPHGLRRWRAEINRNYALVGPEASRWTLLDATRLLTPHALRRPRGLRYLIRRVETFGMRHRHFAWGGWCAQQIFGVFRWIKESCLQVTHPIHRLRARVLRSLPSDGVTSIVGLSAPGNGDRRGGFVLAQSLLGGGYPVVVYDPDPEILTKARQSLGGPVEFVASETACLEAGDVVVRWEQGAIRVRAQRPAWADVRRMRDDWECRAHRNPLHSIASWQTEWDREAFLRSGEEDYVRLVHPVLQAHGAHPEGQTLLELGCGAGRMTGSFATRFREVYALDISHEMLRLGREAQAGSPKILWIQGDGMGLAGFQSEVFDFVFSYIMLQHLPTQGLILGYLREIFRVLKPGGLGQFQWNSQRRPTMNLQGRIVWGLIDRLHDTEWSAKWAESIARSCQLDPLMAGKTWRGAVVDAAEVVRVIEQSGGEILSLTDAGSTWSWCVTRKLA